MHDTDEDQERSYVTKRSTEADLYFDFAKDGRNVSARRVSQQWQLTISK